jgi:hypothetical protein
LYKFKKSGFRYEVGLCIKTGDIFWWTEPHLPGIWNDELVFKHGLVKVLEPAERVEVDGGYWGSALELVKCTGVVEVDLDNVATQAAQSSNQHLTGALFIEEQCRQQCAAGRGGENSR